MFRAAVFERVAEAAASSLISHQIPSLRLTWPPCHCAILHTAVFERVAEAIAPADPKNSNIQAVHDKVVKNLNIARWVLIGFIFFEICKCGG